jgi:hypothetical protein
MVAFYFGKTTNPGTVEFIQDGYWYEDDETPPQFYPYQEPQLCVWPIRKMYGVSIGSVFIGIMRFGKPFTKKIVDTL